MAQGLVVTYPGLIPWKACFPKATFAILLPALICLSLLTRQSLFCNINRKVSLHRANRARVILSKGYKAHSLCVRDDIYLVGELESSAGREKKHPREELFQKKRNKNPGEIRKRAFAESGKASCTGTETKHENALYL